MTDAPVDLADQFTLTGLHEAGLSLADSAIALLVVRRILRDAELRASRANPAADEVAGLTRDLDAVRDAISYARSKLNGYTTLGLDLTYALDRIENHLKGKR